MRILPFVALLSGALGAQAQDLVAPSLDWRTVETRHFVIHYPHDAEAWTLDMAARIDGAYAAVSALVGGAPAARVTVIVEDPNNLANGFALPFLGAPLVFFWPTPPDPASGLGGAGWGEMLSVHEYAHIAHLTRPSRNRVVAALTRLSALDLGPVALKSPRWLIEGYATYVEGKVTGRGRPHSAARAAVLREWARTGQLPTYGMLDGDPRYLGGAMAYLVGSAYLEWLLARPAQGDSSLPRLWRRMSARVDRPFAEAFAGIFGAPPNELYGRFTAEITARALQLEQALATDSARLGAGAVRTLQRLTWSTGSPALSPDDSLLALTRMEPGHPPLVLVWRAHPPPDTAAVRRRAEDLKRDSLDVPGVDWQPPPREAVRTRYPERGAAFGEPRWMPDGRHLLLTRNTGPGDGLVRRDLFMWDTHTNAVRRVTRDGGIRHADPMPDGRSAIADRCVNGVCSVVRVDLATGALTVLALGAPRLVYDRPRVSPDGGTIAAARQLGGGWRVVLLTAAGGSPRAIGPDDGADRYDPAWRANGKSLVVVSDAGGVPNLEEIDIGSGAARPLTRVTSAVRAPEPRAIDGGVYFLHLTPRGLDLDWIAADSAPPLGPVTPLARSPALAPVAFEPPAASDTFPVVPLSPRPYGLGPRTTRVLPSTLVAAEGAGVGLMVSGLDPVGRLTWMAQGMTGTPGTWRGGSVGAAWRGSPVTFGAELFYGEDKPARQWGFSAPPSLDATTAGAVITARVRRMLVTSDHAATLGASAATWRGDSGGASTRALAFAEYAGVFVHSLRTLRSAADVALSGATGTTAGRTWSRGIATLTLRAGDENLGVAVGGSYGAMSAPAATFERFSLGGTAPPFFEPALYGQRIALPALPAGVLVGSSMSTFTAALPILGLKPYYWTGRVGSPWSGWEQLAGLETGFATDGIWYARLPGLCALGGAAYALGGTWRRTLRFYLSLTYRP